MNLLWQWQWIGILLARLAAGLLFAISGAGKLFVSTRREQMKHTLIAAHIPTPGIAAIVVSSVELIFGALLVLGFVTPLGCLMLGAVMVVALSATILPGIKSRPFVAERLRSRLLKIFEEANLKIGSSAPSGLHFLVVGA